MSNDTDSTQLAGQNDSSDEESDGSIDNNDYESEGGADDWYNDGHEGGTHSEDNLYSGIIFWIFCIACAAATIIKPPSAK